MSDRRGYFGYEPYSGLYSKHCMGGKPAITQLLEYFHKFTKFASHTGIPFAAQMENEDLHNSNLLNAHMIDEPLAMFLQTMENDGRGDDTIFILNADHGARYGGGVNAIKLRHFYNTNPTFRMLIPSSLAKTFKNILANNQRRITNSLDIYATLRHIVGGTPDLAFQTGSTWEATTIGRSIFTELPENRGCVECQIDEFRCTCKLGSKKIIFSNPMAYLICVIE